MTKFAFTHEWLAAGNDAPEFLHTTANLALHVGDVNLMQNEDSWSKTIRESVLVSAYPVAMWLASSWWRLNWEPRPAQGVRPAVDWRMAHELGASNHGFVWPQIIFASDGEVMQVWSVASSANGRQSVRYLNGLETPISIALADFRRGAEDFIVAVLDRLDAMQCQDTDLSRLWRLIQDNRADQASAQYRRLEAEMGYDPDECPDPLISKALRLEQDMGAAALSELTPVYGKSATQEPLTGIEDIVAIAASRGLRGAPTDPRSLQTVSPCQHAPWQCAVEAAREVRDALGNKHGLIDNAMLYDLLGLTASAVDRWSAPTPRPGAAIAISDTDNHYKFVPRKRHPLAKRFELARFLGDYLLPQQTRGSWLASTDLATARQKYQKAFAAELLCPIGALKGVLENDYSESAIEDAAHHFQVSLRTVESLLSNNGLVSFPLGFEDTEVRLPYPLTYEA